LNVGTCPGGGADIASVVAQWRAVADASRVAN
jgi:hypothetical protein